MSMQMWEIEAREAIRDAMARYTFAGDSFPLIGLADSFCLDGILEAEGGPTIEGRDNIDRFRREARQRSGGVSASRLLRHNVANIRFDRVTPDEALVSSYYTVFSEIGLDHMGRYRDRFVPAEGTWLIAHRFVTSDWKADASRF